tara:strand:- start:2129 stop:3085 length:957 start_codon:yes stop_codon:yes gene_type:complete
MRCWDIHGIREYCFRMKKKERKSSNKEKKYYIHSIREKIDEYHYIQYKKLIKYSDTFLVSKIKKTFRIESNKELKEESNRESSENKPIKVLCYNQHNLVFSASHEVIKFLFGKSIIRRQNEMFYATFYNKLFDTHLINYVLSNSNSAMFSMKKGLLFEKSFELIKQNSIKIIHDIVKQISVFHMNYTIHNDIKCSNLIILDHKTIVIDFGLMNKYHPQQIPRLDFKCGTFNLNIPNFDKCLYTLTKKKRLFWMYMKDWYGFASILEFMEYKTMSKKIRNAIDSLNYSEIIVLLESIIPEEFQNKLFYLNDTYNQTHLK